ncbi:site-2 protease family protein [Acidiferrimicrobium sp. IK]|uniref:site-2 protease family protein n=1 Tax=Acidiferrimicrobium sp. IK TaxID=2871700 RepID=UPI0021CB59AA|nr:site-2 protease family protein [Acidiferrimicrobium sp. IK]MCU4184738.1 site-2 protease family protein [Acidiferrimicrobium sp. IK]
MADPRSSRRSQLLHPQALVALGLILVAVWALRHTLSSTTLLIFVVVVPSIMLHEVAHGVAALAFGDDTAKRAGRLTLNPLRHVDPIGTLVLPGVLALSGLGAFGYAKPVPINPSRMRSPRNHSLLTSLAGPATNLALAGISIIVLRFARPAGTALHVYDAYTYIGINSLDIADRVLFLLGFLNVSLAVFNLIPLPPLDGSAVVERLLPAAAWPAWSTLRQYAMPILLVVVLWNPHGFLGHIFGPAGQAWADLLKA